MESALSEHRRVLRELRAVVGRTSEIIAVLEHDIDVQEQNDDR